MSKEYIFIHREELRKKQQQQTALSEAGSYAGHSHYKYFHNNNNNKRGSHTVAHLGQCQKVTGESGHCRQSRFRLTRMWNLGTLGDHSSPILQSYQPISRKGLGNRGFFSSRKPHRTDLCGDSGAQLRAFGMWKVEKMVRSIGKTSQSRSKKYANLPPQGFERSKDNTREENEESWSTFSKPTTDNLSSNSSHASPTRDAVLKACTLTSGFLVALGLLIRQASHVASVEGWSILDTSAELIICYTSVGLEMQDVPLTIGTVALISSCRYILLKTWPEFSESSEAANQQVLGSLQDLDYLVELLFRGALLPLLGLNWKSAIVVGAIFGVLHLGGGRRYPFAIWASFVGFTYGMATIVSSSIIVPMVSHSLNNFIGAIHWRYKSSSEKIIG
ncbi:hypothetical protein IEQ34_021633 [Dendrobium chrysotoxum]|uniref:CAAX prenyl protease 2/Lysostaphin resistance protein A-like domain-containing protein n=1 Tax=Dendrobium chrysotoxum TaxID=161865 RepID=A0AAV7G3M2_DENCH|nr:hypothetical protein IEQ34_021633 [Dendrobium chrysotoxum]